MNKLQEMKKDFAEFTEKYKDMKDFFTEEPKIENKGQFIPEIGFDYYRVLGTGTILCDEYKGDFNDKKAIAMGNYYETYSPAEKARDIQQAAVRLQDAWSKDYYWEFDWECRVTEKYQITGWDYQSNQTFIYAYINMDASKHGLIFQNGRDMENFIEENKADLELVLKK